MNLVCVELQKAFKVIHEWALSFRYLYKLCTTPKASCDLRNFQKLCATSKVSRSLFCKPPEALYKQALFSQGFQRHPEAFEIIWASRGLQRIKTLCMGLPESSKVVCKEAPRKKV